MPALYKFLRSEQGPTAVEYAVLLALILGAIIASVGAFGQSAGGMWANNGSQLSNAMSGS